MRGHSWDMDTMNPEEDRWAEEAFRLWRVRRTLMQVRLTGSVVRRSATRSRRRVGVRSLQSTLALHVARRCELRKLPDRVSRTQ